MVLLAALVGSATPQLARAQQTTAEQPGPEVAPLPTAAETPAATDMATQLAELQTAVEQAALAGHNAWMLICCALVLFMTAPGLAMFYGGLVRRKNVLSVMMQCIFLMGLMTVLWALYG